MNPGCFVDLIFYLKQIIKILKSPFALFPHLIIGNENWWSAISVPRWKKVTFINQIVPREERLQISIFLLEDVTIKGGGEGTTFWPLGLPRTISTGLNGTENRPPLWARVRVTHGRQAGVRSFSWHTAASALPGTEQVHSGW